MAGSPASVCSGVGDGKKSLRGSRPDDQLRTPGRRQPTRAGPVLPPGSEQCRDKALGQGSGRDHAVPHHHQICWTTESGRASGASTGGNRSSVQGFYSLIRPIPCLFILSAGCKCSACGSLATIVKGISYIGETGRRGPYYRGCTLVNKGIRSLSRRTGSPFPARAGCTAPRSGDGQRKAKCSIWPVRQHDWAPTHHSATSVLTFGARSLMPLRRDARCLYSPGPRTASGHDCASWTGLRNGESTP
jgi:hypothetical protein